MLLTFGSFRMLDLGDLTWNKEHDLVCPNNLVGTVDLYLTTHHGLDQSGARVLVHAVAPRVAIMNNGAKKGGMASAWRIIRDSPGLEDLWQLHYAVDAGAEANAAEPFIANQDESTALWHPRRRRTRRPLRRHQRPQWAEQDLSTAPRARGEAVNRPVNASGGSNDGEQMARAGASPRFSSPASRSAAFRNEQRRRPRAGRKHVYELRTYTAPDGKLGDLNARFRNHTLRIFEKHGMKNVLYMTPQDAPDSQNTLIYVLEHQSREAAKKSWDAFRPIRSGRRSPRKRTAERPDHQQGRLGVRRSRPTIRR